jgi:deazaflavin-dependent oxidoreductase (nitroreductase family)
LRRAALAVSVVLAALAVADEPPLPEVAAALARVKNQSTIELTTKGRKTGKDHMRPIWFVVEDGKVLVQAGKGGKTDWYQNLQKTPAATMRSGDYTFRVRAAPIKDSKRVEDIHQLFLKKYTRARLLSYVGSSIGRGEPVELIPQSVSTRREPVAH